MASQLWINLPVRDINKSRKFFSDIGFSFNTQHGNTEDSASLVVGNSIVMLFTESTFRNFARSTIADAKQVTEVLISIDAQSTEEIDSLAEKAEKAGATIFGKPSWYEGWMYGCAFADPDGHRWNALYMDMSKIQKP